MIPFRERNPVKIGAISIMVIALLIGLALKADSLPVIGGGTEYYADFAEAGGLATGDDVRVAGVRVGKVSSVDLEGGHVKVGFKVKDPSKFGTSSHAQIKVKTLLGQMYIELDPAGSGQMPAGYTIPIDHTVSPYSVIDAFTGLAKTSGKIDSNQLARALTTLSTLTRNTPQSFRGALDGLSRLSRQLSAKDDRINTLLKNLSRVSTTLDSRDQDIIKLMKNSATLFGALVDRRQAIHNLLVSTRQLADALSDLVDDSRKDLAPALHSIRSLVQVFNQNEESVDKTLRLLAPFYRLFTNTLGQGPWFDTYIQNLPPVPSVGGGQ